MEEPDARTPEVFQRRLVQGPSPWPEFDLVGISSMTAQMDEAYRVADIFRSRGTPVVMGGLYSREETARRQRGSVTLKSEGNLGTGQPISDRP